MQSLIVALFLRSFCFDLGWRGGRRGSCWPGGAPWEGERWSGWLAGGAFGCCSSAASSTWSCWQTRSRSQPDVVVADIEVGEGGPREQGVSLHHGELVGCTWPGPEWKADKGNLSRQRWRVQDRGWGRSRCWKR